jgi:hypothetical protein
MSTPKDLAKEVLKEAAEETEEHMKGAMKVMQDEIDKVKSEDNWPAPAGKGTFVCSNCMWWVKKKDSTMLTIGRCRRRCPTMGGYPATYETDWCGDHKIK